MSDERKPYTPPELRKLSPKEGRARFSCGGQVIELGEDEQEREALRFLLAVKRKHDVSKEAIALAASILEYGDDPEAARPDSPFVVYARKLQELGPDSIDAGIRLAALLLGLDMDPDGTEGDAGGGSPGGSPT